MSALLLTIFLVYAADDMCVYNLQGRSYTIAADEGYCPKQVTVDLRTMRVIPPQ